VSICTLDDAKRLYSGFDLCDAATSVSMTINGPAPMLLAFFLNAAIDQQCERWLQQNGQVAAANQKIDDLYQQRGLPRPGYRGELPNGHNGLGTMLIGVAGDQVVPKDVYAKIRAETLASCEARCRPTS
jgi:methylmalonyl-CoA mutase